VSKVSKCSVLVYSGEQGYQNNRAQITLADSDGNSLAFVRFKDPEMPCELDTETDGIITMHLPSAMFASYLDLIRNEKTDIFYQIGRAFLFAKLRRAGQETPIWRQQPSGPWQARHRMSAQAYQRVR